LGQPGGVGAAVGVGAGVGVTPGQVPGFGHAGGVAVGVGPGDDVTVSVARLLVALPAEFVTTHRKVAPLSAAVAEGSV
jgi:hypothetical protein